MLKGLGKDFGLGKGREDEDVETQAKKLQAVIAKGLAKLILAGMITDKNVRLESFKAPTSTCSLVSIRSFANFSTATSPLTPPTTKIFGNV